MDVVISMYSLIEYNDNSEVYVNSVEKNQL